MDFYVLLIRIVHILGGAVWFGSAFVLTRLVAPAGTLAAWRASRDAPADNAPGFPQAARGVDTHLLLRKRLEAAGIEPETEAGRVDFHSLRVTFITALARGDVHPKKAQELARHSSINLTMQVYTKPCGLTVVK